MCGIAGWAFAPPDEARLRRALAALSHRGPDGEGVFTDPRASLGHRRLAIIDLSSDGLQPMANEDGAVRVVYNGEIYNFAALRRELAREHRFVSRTDTEVLVHGYEAWGMAGLLERVQGMFAFALWDGRRGQLHLARDRIGKKPLYHARTPDGGLYFASTLPALLEMLPATPALRPEAIVDYLLYQCVPADGAMLRGVHKLLPGHRASCDGGPLVVDRYFRLSFRAQERRSADEWERLVEDELRRATSERLVADVPVGVFLSGGVDSSVVTALAVEQSASRVTTIAAGFEDERKDELAWARMVARHLGTDHHEHVVRADAAAELPWLVYAAGEPLGDPALLPTMLLSRVAKEHVTVVLTGDGGDEAFAGYFSTLVARAAGVYRALVPQALRRTAIPRALAALSRRRGGAVARKLLRLAAAAPDQLRWRFDPIAEKSFRGMTDLLAPSFAADVGAHDPDAYWDAVWAACDGPTDVDRALQHELEAQLPDKFLVKTDTASMAFGIEVRCPLLDARVLELAARIPADVKLAGLRPKALLKRIAVRHVPPAAVLRRKHGFSLPLASWFRGPLAPLARRLLSRERLGGRGLFRPESLERLLGEHGAGTHDHGERLWSLVVLELWFEILLDRTLSPRDVLVP